MRQNIVAGNWKMNTNQADALDLAAAVANGLNGSEKTKIIVCPPLPWLVSIKEKLANSSVLVGAQNCSNMDKGAFTGEVSASMLASAGISYVLVGHSERRSIYHESNQTVAEKLAQVLNNKMIAILCIGETLEERNAGELHKIIDEQLSEALKGLDNDAYKSIIIAYEPVWAIGTGLTATPEQAQEVHAYIRLKLGSMTNQNIADEMSILYGGSCNASNAATLFAQPDIDGGLIGGASLKAEDFLTIARSF
ncbi:MAG: triose-phosphate isomerase [Bacteroidia bacterium]